MDGRRAIDGGQRCILISTGNDDADTDHDHDDDDHHHHIPHYDDDYKITLGGDERDLGQRAGRGDVQSLIGEQ